MGFYGGLWSLQDPPYWQVNHTGGRTHKINHLSVAHIGHICVVHLEMENKRFINYGLKGVVQQFGKCAYLLSCGEFDEKFDTTLINTVR